MNEAAVPCRACTTAFNAVQAECAECLQQDGNISLTSSPGSSGIQSSVCTERCVVVECHNAEHVVNGRVIDDAQTTCVSTGCDTSCTQASQSGTTSWLCDLPDCSLEELLQCCSDDYSATCAGSCEPPPLASIQQWSPWQAPGVGHLQGQASHTHFHPQIHAQGHNSQLPYDISGHAAICMWADCHREFPDQASLLSHIQLEHLGISTTDLNVHSTPGHAQFDSRIQPTLVQQQHQSENYLESTNRLMECLWDDCATSLPISQECNNCTISNNHTHAWDADAILHHLLSAHIHEPEAQQVHFPSTLHSHSSLYASLDSKLQEMQVETTTTASSPTLEENSHDLCDHGPCPCEWEGCTATFLSCDELTTHITEVHVGHGKSSYGCHWKGCDRHGELAFSSKQKVLRHIQKHSGYKPHVCSVCQERFAEATSLQQHMRRHTHEKPYVCDFPGCGKAFSIPGGLRIHKRAHSGERPFKCPEPGCDRAFAESSNLAKHMRIHTGLKPFHCTHPGCGKSFGRKDQLLRHTATHRSKGVTNESTA